MFLLEVPEADRRGYKYVMLYREHDGMHVIGSQDGINWDGRLLVIGFASGRIPEAPANLTLLKNCSIVGVFWGAWTEREPQGNRDNVAELFQWVREGKLRPHISHSFSLAQVPDALNALINRQVVGKAVVEID